MSLMSKLQGTEAIKQQLSSDKRELGYIISFVMRHPLVYDDNVLSIAYKARYNPTSVKEDKQRLDDAIKEYQNPVKKEEPKPWWKFWK